MRIDGSRLDRVQVFRENRRRDDSRCTDIHTFATGSEDGLRVQLVMWPVSRTTGACRCNSSEFVHRFCWVASEKTKRTWEGTGLLDRAIRSCSFRLGNTEKSSRNHGNRTLSRIENVETQRNGEISKRSYSWIWESFGQIVESMWKKRSGRRRWSGKWPRPLWRRTASCANRTSAAPKCFFYIAARSHLSSLILLNSINFQVHDSSNLECHLCLKRFDQTLLFNRHMKTHYGPNAQFHVQCELCERQFKDKDSLKTHMTVSHQIGGVVEKPVADQDSALTWQKRRVTTFNRNFSIRVKLYSMCINFSVFIISLLKTRIFTKTEHDRPNRRRKQDSLRIRETQRTTTLRNAAYTLFIE